MAAVPSSEEAAGELVVSVVGAVSQPELLTLPAGSRVADALAQVQTLPEADLVALNQAQLLVDGILVDRAFLEERRTSALELTTVDELAERMNISEDDVLEALEMSNAMTPASLDAQVADEDSETSLSTFLGFNDPGYSDFERNDMLDRALSTLDNRQRAVIIARFYEGLSQRDVAAQLNISQMTVSRIERQALEKLRERMTEQE